MKLSKHSATPYSSTFSSSRPHFYLSMIINIPGHPAPSN